VSDFGKEAAADFVRVAREIRESSTSSMSRQDGGHFSFSVPAKVVPASPPQPTKPPSKT
jgi:hypothetical protein